MPANAYTSASYLLIIHKLVFISNRMQKPKYETIAKCLHVSSSANDVGRFCQRRAHFLGERLDSKFFSLWEPHGLCHSSSAFLLQCGSSHRQFIRE